MVVPKGANWWFLAQSCLDIQAIIAPSATFDERIPEGRFPEYVSEPIGVLFVKFQKFLDQIPGHIWTASCVSFVQDFYHPVLRGL